MGKWGIRLGIPIICVFSIVVFGAFSCDNRSKKPLLPFGSDDTASTVTEISGADDAGTAVIDENGSGGAEAEEVVQHESGGVAAEEVVQPGNSGSESGSVDPSDNSGNGGNESEVVDEDAIDDSGIAADDDSESGDDAEVAHSCGTHATGVIRVTNDAVNLYVTYTSSQTSLKRIHLLVGTMVKKQNKLVPHGRILHYKTKKGQSAAYVVFTVPLAKLGLSGKDCGKKIFVAVRAKFKKGSRGAICLESPLEWKRLRGKSTWWAIYRLSCGGAN